jgi:2',3'-cyclic-nucleotide 2'-phosphodiesterase (5'-nucleotidase family)
MRLSARSIFFLLFLFIFQLSCSPPPAKVQKVEMQEYNLSGKEYSDEDSLVLLLVKPYKDTLDADMNLVLIRSDQVLDKGQPESRLGNMFSDICLAVTNEQYHPADGKLADFAFFNNGGLRNSLPKGDVTKGNIFELMPFENELIILTLNGATVKKIFNFIASKGGVPVSGLRMGIQNGMPVNMTIDGIPFDSSKVYKMVTSDYLANGGDECFFLQDAVKSETLHLKIRDALIDFLKLKGSRHELLHSDLDKRIMVLHAK